MLRYKSKLVTKKVLEHRIKLKAACVELNRKKAEKFKSDEETRQNNHVVEGDRIVSIAVLGKNLVCAFCGQVLSLLCVEKETLTGLASAYDVRCHHCLRVTPVPANSCTVPQNGDNRSKVYDVNSRIVLGSLSAGLGHTQLNKLTAAMNIPCMDNKLFKRHERLVGPSIERVAKSSCLEAVKLEKSATLANIDCISKMLPNNLPADFLVPNINNPENIPATRSITDPPPTVPSASVSSTTVFPPSPPSTPTPSPSVPFATTHNVDANANETYVRLMASYDMGWSKRGTGRSYDSLSGFGALIGSQTGLVLDYGTRNRKCRLCDLGRPKSEHDCRCNFSGSAKAMEGDLAAQLANHSDVLNAANVDVGILIGDDDSSTIAAIRKATTKQVVKLSDLNHIEKGVTKKLYELKSKHKELSADGIQWLQSCFSYAVKQNVGDTKAIADILQQIPRHAFNDHSTCSDWCKAVETGEDYDHTRVPGGFHSSALFTELTNLFQNLSENCAKFAHASSSQANESLNNSMASVAPKSKCYSTSESGDYRSAITVAKKNIGPLYTESVTKDLHLPSVNGHTKRYLSGLIRKAQRRKENAKTKLFKRRRNHLKQQRSQLKNRKESSEGACYQSNMGLMQNDILNDDTTLSGTNFEYLASSASSDEVAIVYFDLETGSLASNAEILQIGLRFKEHSYGVYVTPTKPISEASSKVHSLTYVAGEMLYQGVRVSSVPLSNALKAMLKFLSAIKRRCVLVAHNAKFDYTRLVCSLKATRLLNAFQEHIVGFRDTLPLFRDCLTRNKNCSLVALAEEAHIEVDGAHDAVQDALILQQLKEYHQISDSKLLESIVTLDSICSEEIDKSNQKRVCESLKPLESVISKAMILRLACAQINLAKLSEVYGSENSAGVENLFTEVVNGKPRITKNNKVIQGVLSYLKDQH